MDQETSRFIERVGMFFETDGFPRIAGRLFGVLYLSPAPQSLDDLAVALNVSKASISINARRLAQTGLIERIAHGNDRRDYYQANQDTLGAALSLYMARIDAFSHLLSEFQELPQLRDPAVLSRAREYTTGRSQLRHAIESALAARRTVSIGGE